MKQIRNLITEATPIQSDFHITEDTNIIIPAKHTNYDSIVLEGNEVYAVRQTPDNIINQACQKSGYDLEIKQKQTKILSEHSYKLPVSLSDELILVAFPTKGINDIDCAWIMIRNVFDIGKHESGSVVIFKNGQQVILDISFDILKNQCIKATELYNHFYSLYLSMIERVQEGKEAYIKSYETHRG